MKVPTNRVSAVAVVIALATKCFGQANLVLTPTVANLHQLEVDSPVVFLVELTGLPAGSGLDALFATVEYDGNLLGIATLTPGGTLPNPLHDPLDFATNTQPGMVDGAFTTFGTTEPAHISNLGVFYSFTITPIAVGSGSIGLSFTDASQFNASNPGEPILIGATANDALTFTVIGNLPGDYNNDEVVDAADYTVWRDRLGSMGSPGIPADGSGPIEGIPDGVVDQFDYTFWKSQFGASSNAALVSGLAIQVPEADTLGLFLLGAMALILARGMGKTSLNACALVASERGATA